MENKQNAVEMNFELVKETSTQRFYKSNIAIKNFPRKQFDWEKEIESSKKRLKEGVEMLDDECYYVCVSDAHTHIERLVFVAGRFKKSTGEIIIELYSMLHIDGSLTFMTHGGNSEAVYDDEVYLRHIKMVNHNNQ